MKETFYHVTALSNFARGFDKYARVYSKEQIPESTFPNQFFLLRGDDLGIGFEKAARLISKLGYPGNRAIVLQTEIESTLVKPNLSNGRGYFVESNRIPVAAVRDIDRFNGPDFKLNPLSTEDAMAASLRLLQLNLMPYSTIQPRAISFLPVALACQAKCPFCFSKASVSSEQPTAKPDWEKTANWLKRAKALGAERAVITGGGEPTLLDGESLLKLIVMCAGEFQKVVLITNGRQLAIDGNARTRLETLNRAGLAVLALSRHHHEKTRNAEIMGIDTASETLITDWREGKRFWPKLRTRLVCVLQTGGIDSQTELHDYISWGAENGVEEICFKELYVSTSAESVYHDRAANDWSRSHQVPLSLVTDFAQREGFELTSRLPWGAPIYQGQWRGRQMRIAAYTEPSLFWERTKGIARSWNVMADGHCLVSLEDRSSELAVEASA